MRQVLDRTIGTLARHIVFVIARAYFTLFYNITCTGKHLLQGQEGALILATHVSRHDGPLITTVLYSTTRIRPTVHYNEYYHWLQWLPMFITGAIPMSSPQSWPAEKRATHKAAVMGTIHKVLARGQTVLIFPAGKARRQAEEIVPPHFTGVRDIIRTAPELPVFLLRLEGLGTFQEAEHDHFWRFVGVRKGRRHVSVQIIPLTGLDASMELNAFNQHIERLLNDDVTPERG